MSVQVDGAGGYNAALGVDLFGASGADLPADLDYPVILDGQVSPVPGTPVPSTMVPPRMTRSYSGIVFPL